MNSIMILAGRALKTIKGHEMLKPGDRVLVCVSGGPDSLFLLYALESLKRVLGIELVVCNLDHGLRGRQSREDSRFVAKVCGALGLRLIRGKLDLKKGVGGRKLSTEETARAARYKFFIDSAKRCRANAAATGHTLDDQAETVLMRLIKGTSLKGIVGIPPVREEGGVKIIRPLIEIERKEIEDCLNKAKIDFRIDRTNAQDIYFRNVMRNKVIPYLEKFNPRLKRSLFNLAEHLREDYEFIEGERLKVSKRVIGLKGKEVTIGLKDLVVQPRALQKEIMRDSLEKAGGNIKKLTFRHWKDIEGFIKYKRRGNALDLPGGVRLARTDRALVFHKVNKNKIKCNI